MEVWWFALGSVLIVSLLSLAGAFTLSLSPRRLERAMFLLVSFAVGAMFGGATLHLIPRSFEQLGDGQTVGLLVLAGVMGFFVLEKFLHWRHDHGVVAGGAPHHHEHEHHHHGHSHRSAVRPFAMMNLVGDAAHNLLDGMIIAAAYLVSIPTGIVTTLAVMMHEIPQEISDFSVLVYGGFEPKRALLFNFLNALWAVVGAAVALTIGAHVEGFASYLLPVTAGSFIYIAGSDLIPELHSRHSRPATKSVWQFVMIVLGIAFMLLPSMLEDALGLAH